MTFALHAESALRIDQNGAIRIGNTRITLDLIVDAYRAGITPDEIVEQYTTLELADVYSAIGYYLRNVGEVDSYMKSREKQADEVREEIEANQNPVREIRGKLLERRSTGEADASSSR